MQGIETLPYEVYELPMVPEGGIQRYEQAADMLAEFGRNGDTYIVHAAEGETMVPMEVLDSNPRLKKMLFTQMEEMGIEPERYVVGNELNSINPVTGQPEFFLKKVFRKIKRGAKKLGKKVAKVAKKVAPIVLPIVAPFLLPAMPLAFATGIGSLAGGLIAGQDFGDALKGAVIAGGLAGVGNMAFGGSEGFGSGSFFGSRAAPSQGLGAFSFKEAVTPVNPFSQAGKSTLAGLQQKAALQAKQAVDPNIVGTDALGGDIKYPGSENLSERIVPDDRSMFEKAFDSSKEFYQKNISPSGIEANVDNAKIIADAQNIKAQTIANQTALGIPIDEAAIAKEALAKATAANAPGAIAKYAPMAALGTGAAVAADYATDGAVLGIFRDDDGDGRDDSTGMTMEEMQAAYPDAFFDGEKFYGKNRFYDRSGVGATAQSLDPNANAMAAFDLLSNQPFQSSGLPTLAGSGSGQFSPGQTTGNVDRDRLLAAFDSIYNRPLQNRFQSSGFPGLSSIVQGSGQFSPQIPMMGGFEPYAKAASGGEIVGPGTPTSDSIPAMLSDGEFVMNARAVRGAGGGDRQKGAKKMYAMMRQFEGRA